MTQQPMRPGRAADEITLSCMDSWGRTVDVPTTVSFCVDDPYAVTLVFHSSGGDVEWMFARALLLQGLAAPAGEGDVKVYPSIDEDARAVTILDFCSPDGRLLAQADSHAVQAFLARTFALVPAGAESSYLDLDRLVADLLYGSQ